MSAIAIIPARGGSKRIPKKNIKDFCGKPIIAYSIEAALDSQLYDTVMVSTDSEEIAEIAQAYGAEVPFLRSEKTSGDFATTAEVLLEVLERSDTIHYPLSTIHYFSCIYPCAPFVTAGILRDAMAAFIVSDAIQLTPVVAFSPPPQRGFCIGVDGKLAMKWPENFSVRTQDLETIYHDAGQFYCFRTEAYVAAKGIITSDICPFVLSENSVQDIDNEDDWALAEMKYQRFVP
jgi:N-acylneuraminate cytidylyltransferase